MQASFWYILSYTFLSLGSCAYYREGQNGWVLQYVSNHSDRLMFSTGAFAKPSSDSVMFVSWRISLSTSSKAGGSRFVATTVDSDLHLPTLHLLDCTTSGFGTPGTDGIAFMGIGKD